MRGEAHRTPIASFSQMLEENTGAEKKLMRKRALSQIHFVASFVDRKQNGCGVPSTSPRIKNSCIVDIKVNNRGVEGGGSFDHGNSCFGYP